MRAALLLATVAILAAPSAFAGFDVPATQAGAYCVVVDNDACSSGPFTSLGLWGMGYIGAYVGELRIDLEGGGVHHTFICRSILTGITWFDLDTLFGTCDHIGPVPPNGVPLMMTCSSRGSGVALCSINGP